MLALHALWTCEHEGRLLLWAEDGARPVSATRARRAASSRAAGALRPLAHPYAASARAVREALERSGDAATSEAAPLGIDGDQVVLWLPGDRASPQASPELVRDDGSDTAGSEPSGLWPFVVPVLAFAAGDALDVTLGLCETEPPDARIGASVAGWATVARLAFDVVAGGRVLPALVHNNGGTYARWEPLGGGADAERLRLVAASLPPVCRSAGGERGPAPTALAAHALGAFVDALCRRSLRRPLVAPRPLAGARASRSEAGARPPVEAWLAALGPGGSGEVRVAPRSLAALGAAVAQWREGAMGRGGPWRVCFRLREPGPAEPDERWRVEILLQATDDLSLLVDADAVWRSGETLRRAARTLDSPQEVLLAELGRAVRSFPELDGALREASPTAVELNCEGAHRFLTEVAPALEVTGFGVLVPSWWRSPSGRLGLRLHARERPGSPSATSRGVLTQSALADFDWRVAVADNDIALDELRRLARLKAPLVRVRGQWVEMVPGEVERMVEFLAPGRRRERLTLAEAVRAGAGEGPGGLPVVGVEAEGLVGKMVRGALEDALEPRPTPEGFRGELRPYQRRGVSWLELLETMGMGACLADDMGLGKTPTLLALVQAERAHRPGHRRHRVSPTLVVCPTSVVGNWEREAARFTPSLRVLVHHGAGRHGAEEFARAAADSDIVITTYPLVERDRAGLRALRWGRLVLDEAQHVKNPAAKQTRAVRAIDAEHRVALTGTPVENRLSELWSIMEILNPGLLGSEAAFRERFAVPIERYGDEDAAERLRTLTRPFLLRRVKTDRSIIDDLPDKVEMKVVCSLTREQASLYGAVVDEMLRAIGQTEGIERKGLVLATVLRLKQVCNHPAQFLSDGSALEGRSGKLERTVEILEEVLANGERALVFTQFAEMGAMLEQHLRERLKRRVAFLHGGVRRARRDEMVEEFQSAAGSVPIMVLSLRAGGTGLNLTAANHVVHFDRWWNPAVESQATDRAFRIGQRRDVQVRTLVCAGTVEDRIDAMMESKRGLAQRIVGTGEGWLTELSTEELADVLRMTSDPGRSS